MKGREEVERQVLGGMLRAANNLQIGLMMLGADDFHTGAHRLVFEAIVALHEAGTAVDLVQLANYIGVEKVIRLVGGYDLNGQLWVSACKEMEFPSMAKVLSGGVARLGGTP
jgi:replicative DNA helicase